MINGITRQPAFTPRDVINPIAAATATTQKVDRWITGGFGFQGATLGKFERDLDHLYRAEEIVGELHQCIRKIRAKMEKIIQNQSWYFHRKNKRELVDFCDDLAGRFRILEETAEKCKERAEDLTRLAEERADEWGVADYLSESCEIF